MVSSANAKVRVIVARAAALGSAAANQLALDADAAVRVAAISVFANADESFAEFS
jgi:hypothetical protein